PESVMKAMNSSWKYANRYGYPDANIVQEIAKHHGVKPENILLTAGSGEALDVIGTAYLLGGKKVLGVEPTYSSVYQHATSIKTSAVKLPLGKDYRQDIAATIKAANARASEIGLVYLCNPNNPTGLVITKQEVKQLLEDVRRAARARLRRDSVADQLLHGVDWPRDSAGHRGVPPEESARRPSVPADDDAHARLGWHRGRNGPLHESLQGNLPGEGGGEDDGGRLVNLQL